MENFLNHARKKPALLKYFPDEQDWKHLDKKWVCDVMYTQDTQAVTEMIKKAMSDRKKKLEESQNLLVGMRPEFAAALQKCESFSCKDPPFLNCLQHPRAKQHSY